jgi:hypothetical protein
MSRGVFAGMSNLVIVDVTVDTETVVPPGPNPTRPATEAALVALALVRRVCSMQPDIDRILPLLRPAASDITNT